MFFFLYNFIWTLAVILLLPFRSMFRNVRISDELGLGLHIAPSENGRVWIHALSVGEVISAVPLIKAIKSRYPSLPVVFTVKTSQGMDVAEKVLNNEVENLVPMPIDFWWSYSRMFHKINPLVLIYVEGDVWPGLLTYVKKRGVKAFLVNGRISPRTFSSYKKFGLIARSLLNKFELCLMQSEIDRERLIDIGVFPERIKVPGNIKFDKPWREMDEGERARWLDLLNLNPDKIIWVAGSTHEGEDRIILETYLRLKDDFPELILIIAPRRIETAEGVYNYSLNNGLEAALRSRLGNNRGLTYDVLVLDTIGELDRIYGLAHISFVGGSMVPVGGHNLLEPANFGCPVLFGEHTHNFLLMSEGLIESGGGWRVKNGEDLFKKMKALLSDNELQRTMGSKACGFVRKNCGAVARVLEHLGGYIDNNA